MLNNGNARRRGTFWWSDPTRKFLRHTFTTRKCLSAGDCARLKRIPKGSKLLATKLSGTRWKSRYERQAKPRRWLCNIWAVFKVESRTGPASRDLGLGSGPRNRGLGSRSKGFPAGLWELSRFSMLNKKKSFLKSVSENPNFKKNTVSSTAPPPADLVQCLREQISLRLVSKSKSPRGGSSARYCALTPSFSLGARLTTRQTETDPRILFT